MRYYALDLWRGVACLMVVIGHTLAPLDNHTLRDELTWWFFLGVPMFFVISGYCIAASCDRPQTSIEFFKRRMRRIYPPYWVALVVFALFGLLWPTMSADLPSPLSLTAAQWFGNLTLTETWRFHLSSDPARFLAVQAWTLCYEEQFYVISGLLLISCGRYVFAGMAVVTAAVVALMLSAPGAQVNGFFFDGHWLLFAQGVALYWVRRYGRDRHRLALVALLAGVGVLTLALHGPTWWYFQIFAMGPLFTAILLILARWDTPTPPRWLAPITLCGVMCYSLYLIHVPITMLVSALLGPSDLRRTLMFSTPIGTALSLAAAYGFHVAVERRFLSRAQRAAQDPISSQRPIVVTEGPTLDPL